MNIKVVIIWSFFIILLFGLGLIGYFNQDLLLIKDDTYIPIGNEGTTSVTCSKKTSEFTSTYRFSIKDNVIDRISILYKTNIEDVDAYTSASNINQAISYEKLKGLSVTMYGGISDFSLNVNVKPDNYDKARVEEMSEDYNHLSMIIDSITDIKVYKQALVEENSYICE